MDLYDSIEDFIEAYLYFDEPPHKMQYQGEHHRIPHLQYTDQSNQDSSNANSHCGLHDPEVSYQSPEGDNSLDRSITYKEVNKQQLNDLDAEIDPAKFEDLKYKYAEVKAIQQLYCPECYFKCSDPNEMKYHQFSYHTYETTIKSTVDLTQHSYVTIVPAQSSYSVGWNPSEPYHTYYNL